MKKKLRFLVLCPVLIFAVVVSCKDDKTDKLDSILEGKTSVLVDESLLPIIQDELQVFENIYKAKIKLIPHSEKESVLSLLEGKENIIVLPRKLSKEENIVFANKKIIPRETIFARDGIAFIRSKSSDTLIVLKDIIDFMKGTENGIKGLVFDNPNSSSVRLLNELAGITELPKEGVFSFKTNDEVIKYVAENDGLIGVVGINWVAQPSLKMKSTVDKISVLSVKGSGNQYFYPSQENIATQDYPLARDLYIINCQGYEGLGMGFASFIGGEKGQRIILKSGLSPIRVPSRIIKTRSQIESTTK
jgi:phosphate transport system substrate-binding protein